MTHRTRLHLALTFALGFCCLWSASLTQAQSQVSVSPTFATEEPTLYGLLDGMGMYEIIALMSEENMRGGADLEAQLFPGAGGEAWQAAVARLHEPARMIALFEEAFDPDELTSDEIETIQAFLATRAGQQVIAGELNARRAFLDRASVEEANAVLMTAIDDRNPRLEILHRFNEINGLIDRNVSGALNLRYAFYQGLIEGGAFDDDVPENLMLSEVWSQEPEVRLRTAEWLFSFQLAAYVDVSDADLMSYTDLMNTEAGRAINSALFAAFDEMLTSLSYDLGFSAAAFIAGEDT